MTKQQGQSRQAGRVPASVGFALGLLSSIVMMKYWRVLPPQLSVLWPQWVYDLAHEAQVGCGSAGYVCFLAVVGALVVVHALLGALIGYLAAALWRRAAAG